MRETMTREALISADGVYRYTLRRVWDEPKPLLNFVMLNPSTADGQTDDATVRRCIGFAKLWGYGGIIITNLYAFRSTDPRKLWSVMDPIGPNNEFWLRRAAKGSDKIVCAWGANAPLERAEDVRRLLLAAWTIAHRGQPAALYCFGKTKNGEPKHPVRLARDTQLVEL